MPFRQKGRKQFWSFFVDVSEVFVQEKIESFVEREKRRLDQSEKKKIWFVSEGVYSSDRCARKYGRRRNEIMIRFPLSHSTETTTRNLVSSSTPSLPTKTHLKNSFSSPSSGNANLCCASLCLDDCCFWAQNKCAFCDVFFCFMIIFAVVMLLRVFVIVRDFMSVLDTVCK